MSVIDGMFHQLTTPGKILIWLQDLVANLHETQRSRFCTCICRTHRPEHRRYSAFRSACCSWIALVKQPTDPARKREKWRHEAAPFLDTSPSILLHHHQYLDYALIPAERL